MGLRVVVILLVKSYIKVLLYTVSYFYLRDLTTLLYLLQCLL